MEINLTQIILAVVTLLFGLLMRYVVPSLKNNLDNNQMQLLRIAVRTAVYAAEQLYNSDQGKEKLEYVINLLAEQGYIIDVENVTDTMRAQIEAFVKELHIVQQKVSTEESK